MFTCKHQKDFTRIVNKFGKHSNYLLGVPVAGSTKGVDDMSSNPPSDCPSTRTRRLATAEDKSYSGAGRPPLTGAGIKLASHQHDLVGG